MGTILVSFDPLKKRNEDEHGEYRTCNECHHLFWSIYDDCDEPCFECPHCQSFYTEFIGFDNENDHNMMTILKNHPEDHPIINEDEFEFTDYSNPL